MTHDPTRTLEAFNAIDPQTIAKDLREAEGNLAQVSLRIKALRTSNRASRTPETYATLAHLAMVQAHELCRMDHIAPEYKMFYAALGADDLMTAVEMASYTKGRLGELAVQMEEIRRRQGLAEGDVFFRWEAPPDYLELASESEQIFKKVSGTVFAHVLRRYHLHEQADLFDHNRQEFQIQVEIGRRAMVGDLTGMPEVAAAMDTEFEKEHGMAALLRVRQRAAEIRWSGR